MMRVLVVFIPFLLMCMFWRRRVGGWRETFLVAAILWGAWVAVTTEFLSTFNAITPRSLFIAWIVAAVAVAAATPWIPRMNLPAEFKKPGGIFSRFVLFFSLAEVAALAALLGVMAWIGPSNNWDSMNYHLPRVLHWMQNRNVAFFPCPDLREIEMAPGAEYVILHLQSLSGGDRFSTVAQWFAYVGCIVGISVVAGFLGAGLAGQVFAAVLAATLPMACFQAVSAQNNLAAAFWLICFFVFILAIWKSPGDPPWGRVCKYALAGTSLGLAILTKSTVYLFAAPFCLGFAGIVLWKKSRRDLGGLALLAVITLALNAPTYARNYRYSHHLTGTGGVGDGGKMYYNDPIGVGAAVSNLLRNSALELGDSPLWLQNAIGNTVVAIHRTLGLDPQNPKTTWPGTHFSVSDISRGEDSEPNPFHFVLLAAAILTLLFAGKVYNTSRLYALGVLAGFVLFCACLRWQPWHSRLLLPLMIAGAAFTGAVMEQHWNRGVALTLALLLPWFAEPAIFRNVNHPWFGPYSIFTLDREHQYFIPRPDMYVQCRQVVDLAVQNHCRQVGLLIGPNEWEYPLDMMLRDRLPKVRVEYYPQSTLYDSPLLRTPNPGWDQNRVPWIEVKISGEIFFAFRGFPALNQRPTAAVEGISGGWITSAGVDLDVIDANFAKFPVIRLYGANWSLIYLPHAPKITATLQTDQKSQPLPVQATFSKSEYDIRIDGSSIQPGVEPCRIHLAFDSFFIPQDFKIGPDTRHLVVQAPSDVLFLPGPP